ncbi:MAG: AAA family ATPase [Christensenellaceae bacterium]|jgi:ATP-dependent DNA helicase RecG|nr:AAA family ATPase [Christensenellaceae bacterium]
MSSTIKANTNEESMLFRLANNIPFDDRPNHSATLADLRPSYISNFLYRINSDMYEISETMSIGSLATNMHISGEIPENIRPLNVGLLFFNDRPDKFFPNSWIEVVNKPDPTGDLMIERTFYGPLDKQLTDALGYIRNSILAEKVVKFPNRAESVRYFNYPYRAIQELLGNAVHHKGYDTRHPITVYVTPENMAITSAPGPDLSISDENLKQYKMISSLYRNRRIGDFLKELKFVEGRNTGIPRAIKALIDNGSSLPLFETDPERSYFRVTIPIHNGFLSEREDDNSRELAGVKFYRSKEEICSLIIKILDGGAFSKADLVQRMGYSKLNNTIASVIEQMLSDGIIVSMTQGNVHDPDQKLRLSRITH